MALEKLLDVEGYKKEIAERYEKAVGTCNEGLKYMEQNVDKLNRLKEKEYDSLLSYEQDEQLRERIHKLVGRVEQYEDSINNFYSYLYKVANIYFGDFEDDSDDNPEGMPDDLKSLWYLLYHKMFPESMDLLGKLSNKQDELEFFE